MLGLMIKDGYAVVKQAKILLLLAILFALLPSDFMFGYSIFYMAMLPITALAYDERAKWHKLADMMPYSSIQIVGSKYVMGYLSAGLVIVLIMLSRLFYNAIGVSAINGEEFSALVLVGCIAFTVQAINLPLMFKIGVEKGRLLFVLIIVVIIVMTMSALESNGYALLENFQIEPAVLLAVVAGITIVVNLISIKISEVIYNRKK